VKYYQQHYLEVFIFCSADAVNSLLSNSNVWLNGQLVGLMSRLGPGQSSGGFIDNTPNPYINDIESC